MLSIWVHIIWEKRIKDPKAIVEFEMQAAKLYIDWLQKVNLNLITFFDVHMKE
jgi:hypothetical protein